MRRDLLVAAVMLLSFNNASAQAVYKCVGPDGAVAYQSNRCDADQQATDAWSAQPISPQRAAQIAERERRRDAARQRLHQRANQYRNAGATAQIPVRPQSGQSACDRVREHRRKLLLRGNLSRPQRDRLDEEYFRVCY